MNNHEIDRLVAEKVMEWKWEYIEKIDRYGFRDEKGFWHINFRPSTDLLDAWKVVEKLRDRYVYMNLTNNDDSYCCELMEQDLTNSSRYFTYYADAETAPLAICLTALKSVGVEVEDDDD